MNILSFKNSIPALFKSAEDEEQKQYARLDAERQKRETEKGVALNYATRRENVEKAEADYELICHELDAYCVLNVAATASTLGRGLANLPVSISVVARHCAEVDALKAHLPELKSELRKVIVGPVEKSLQDFRREHKQIISKLPKLEKKPAPPVVQTVLSRDFFINGESANLARQAMGDFSRPAREKGSRLEIKAVEVQPGVYQASG